MLTRAPSPCGESPFAESGHSPTASAEHSPGGRGSLTARVTTSRRSLPSKKRRHVVTPPIARVSLPSGYFIELTESFPVAGPLEIGRVLPAVARDSPRRPAQPPSFSYNPTPHSTPRVAACRCRFPIGANPQFCRSYRTPTVRHPMLHPHVALAAFRWHSSVSEIVIRFPVYRLQHFSLGAQLASRCPEVQDAPLRGLAVTASWPLEPSS